MIDGQGESLDALRMILRAAPDLDLLADEMRADMNDLEAVCARGRDRIASIRREARWARLREDPIDRARWLEAYARNLDDVLAELDRRAAAFEARWRGSAPLLT